MGKSARCASTVCLLQSQCSYLFSRPSATLDVIGQAQYALDLKEKALPLYEQAFNIVYPLLKLDTLVANGFDTGAMENWVIALHLSSHRGKLD